MNALLQTMLVTAREITLVGANHASKLTLQKAAHTNEWLKPGPVLSMVGIAVMVAPPAYRLAKDALGRYQVRRYVNQRMKETNNA